MKNSSVFLIIFLFFLVDIKAQRKNKSISQSINYEIPNLNWTLVQLEVGFGKQQIQVKIGEIFLMVSLGVQLEQYQQVNQTRIYCMLVLVKKL